MTPLDHDVLQDELKRKRICRFCMTQEFYKLTNIFNRDTRIKSSAPLPIQVMAIASIEIFSNDGLPPYVCTDCTDIFEYSYQFKQMCKKADNLLRQYPLTGKWPECLDKPIFSNILSSQTRVNKTVVKQESLLMPKKILNSAVKIKPAVATAVITPDKFDLNYERLEEDCSITFLDKIENNDELSLDDIQQLMAAEDRNEAEFVTIDNLPVVVVDSGNKTTKPKLLNKSSVRILNTEAECENEPRLSLPKIKKDIDGKTEIVAEILNIDDVYEEEPNPTDAAPIETNVFPCPHCDRTFPLLQLRDIHLKNHNRDRKFQCEECDKSFFSKYDLQRHSFIHNGEKPFKCSVCHKAFSRSSLLTRHEGTHTDVPKHICVHCERSFLSKDDMERHAERHFINRPFVCKICKKGFAFKQGLERHEVIHSRQQPFSCHYCEQSFSTTSKLARHLTAHAGHRPYPCKFCRKSYLLSHHLTRHMRSHRTVEDTLNAISFLCVTCNKSFATRGKLILHSITHVSELNLACPLCKEVFDNKDILNSHIHEHSDGEAYACEFCDLFFIKSEKLQSHIDLQHSQEMEAYHADDRAQADKHIQESQKQNKNNKVVSDEKLQKSFNEFLDEELSNETNELKSTVKYIKSESDKKSPKIINQVVIRNAADDQKNKNQIVENKSLLIPLKQRMIDVDGGKLVTKTPQQTKQSPQLRRKTPVAAGPLTAKDTKQPSIQSLLLPQNITLTKASLTKRTPEVAISVPKPKIIKHEKEPLEVPSTSNSTAVTIVDNVKLKINAKKGKVQKITVTKAQAAAMAKEGRIKVKDGKIILKK